MKILITFFVFILCGCTITRSIGNNQSKDIYHPYRIGQKLVLTRDLGVHKYCVQEPENPTSKFIVPKGTLLKVKYIYEKQHYFNFNPIEYYPVLSGNNGPYIFFRYTTSSNVVLPKELSLAPQRLKY